MSDYALADHHCACTEDITLEPRSNSVIVKYKQDIEISMVLDNSIVRMLNGYLRQSIDKYQFGYWFAGHYEGKYINQ